MKKVALAATLAILAISAARAEEHVQKRLTIGELGDSLPQLKTRAS